MTTEIENAVDRLAAALHARLADRERRPLSESLSSESHSDTALAAVRVLGCDVLAPALARGEPPCATERAVLAEALNRLPATSAQPVEVRMISIAVSGFALNGDCAPAAAEQACNEWWWQVGDSDWRELARSLMWLAPMAWPHTSGFAIRKLAQREIDVGRAVTRALMRRDYAAAARLCRWAALVEAGGATVGLDLGKVLERLELVSGGGPQTALHTVLGRLALTAGGAR